MRLHKSGAGTIFLSEMQSRKRERGNSHKTRRRKDLACTRAGKQHNTVSIIILMTKTDQSQMILENTGEYARGPYIIFTTCLCFRVPRGIKPPGGKREQQEHFAICKWKNYTNEKTHLWPVQVYLMANLSTIFSDCTQWQHCGRLCVVSPITLSSNHFIC